ncbi:hypothetical protein M2132_000750 [Dysgonomonas sp. PH5-45]|uniref:hypothetical protein n=1 Tax=unclassified Dysgonomonas TaxID=2630389 RepID=UPI00247609D7|nr:MULTISPECIES: hypothetical protein [unclassified Dysgonomonas]MDH6354422.1 hypothetical protein [Dysgonomonas sp. PH5-45]MDH6387321.1 hypothetical protein [Dysgonomonas sp. PH5-37]
MKTISKILMLTLMAVLFVSCGGDDDGPTMIEKKETYTHIYKIPVEGIEYNPQTPRETNIYLRDIIGEEGAKNIISADIIFLDSYVKLSGLNQIDTLVQVKDFTIKVGNNATTQIGTFANKENGSDILSDMKLQNNIYLKTVEAVLSSLVKSKSKALPIALTYTPTATLTKGTVPVYLEISVSATFRYRVKASN